MQRRTRILLIKIDTELNGFVGSSASTGVEKFNECVTYIDKPVPSIVYRTPPKTE